MLAAARHEERFEGLATGRRNVLVQGAGRAAVLPPRAVALGTGGALAAPAQAGARAVLRTPLPLPPQLRSALYGGAAPDRARLVVLWSPAAEGSLRWLEELARRADQLDALPLDALPVCADGPEGAAAADPEVHK